MADLTRLALEASELANSATYLADLLRDASTQAVRESEVVIQIVTIIDIADRLDVTKGAVSNWRQRPDSEFPEPLRSVGRGRVDLYYWPDVEAWAKRTGRL